jgi:hypothetical protein
LARRTANHLELTILVHGLLARMADEAEAMDTHVPELEGDALLGWPAQTYSSIMDNLDLPEDAHHGSANSTPVNSTTTTASGFITNYDVKRMNAREAGVCEVDLRALDFVETPNESLVCTICAAPFVTPMELGCEHIFCEDCVYEHLSCGIQSASSCPKCRRPVESLKPVPRLLNQLLDELEVECPNKSSGCLPPLKRYTVTDHVNRYCEYEEVRCRKSSCSGVIQRRFLDKGCLHTHIECDVCNDLIMEKDLEVSYLKNCSWALLANSFKHHEETVCPAALVECDYCHIELRRGQVRKHLDIDCSKVTIHCPGQVVGCKFSNHRETLHEHTINCPMATMSSYLADMSDKQASLAEENKRLRNQVDTLNARLEELEDNHRKLAQSIKKERRRSHAAETTAASASRIEELHGRFDELTADYNTRLDNATSEAARLHMEMMNQAQQNGQRFYTMNGTITSLRTQISHLMTSRPGGAGGGGNTAGSGSGGLAGSGGGTGGGVSLDTARREPPKL